MKAKIESRLLIASMTLLVLTLLAIALQSPKWAIALLLMLAFVSTITALVIEWIKLQI